MIEFGGKFSSALKAQLKPYAPFILNHFESSVEFSQNFDKADTIASNLAHFESYVKFDSASFAHGLRQNSTWSGQLRYVAANL